MIVYAIRNRYTGLFMPYRYKKGGGGEPTADIQAGEMPRLFLTKVRAKRTLLVWVQGTWRDDMEIVELRLTRLGRPTR